MPAGEAFTPAQRRELERARARAHQLCGYLFSVYVGASPNGDVRGFAERLHARLDEPDRSVLICCDPGGHRLEIVTGSGVRDDLPDTQVALAALSMQTAFAVGDLVGGLTSGLQQLAEHARRP